MNDYFQRELNRIKEVHFFLRPVLSKALESHLIADEIRKHVGNYANYKEIWTTSFSDRFFDMATAIRLGSAIEGCLKAYYMDKKGHSNIPDLEADPSYKKNIFQRVQSWQPDGVIPLYKNELGYDLSTNHELPAVQEAMMHRHLYAHNSGIIDDSYIDKIKKITGDDIATDATIAASYPNHDTYWFEPLKKLNEFIEAAWRFFDAFP